MRTTLFVTASGHHLELFVAENGLLSFKPALGSTKERVFVLSLPKAGTYMTAALLRHLGLVDTQTHARPESFADRRTEESRRQGLVELSITTTASLINEGQFSVGHMAFDWWSEKALRPFQKLLVVREYRACFVSAARYMGGQITDAGERMLGYLRASGADIAAYASKMAAWLRQDRVLVLRYEDMLGDAGPARQSQLIAEICRHVGLATDDLDPSSIVRATLQQPTRTSSGSRSSLEDYWSPEAEELFASIGGLEINRQFGYAS